MPQFDWLCDMYECVMNPTSGIYWVELSFINNYKKSQLWLVLLKYSANVTSAFPWVVTKALGEDGVSLASFDPLIQDTKPLFGYQWKMKIVSLFNLFLLLFMTPLHFLILFIGHIILF